MVKKEGGHKRYWYLIVILICFGVFLFSEWRNPECFETFAIKYCEKNNLSIYIDNYEQINTQVIKCGNPEYNERTRKGQKYLTFYFTEEEKEICKGNIVIVNIWKWLWNW